MEPLDPKAELMRLHDDAANAYAHITRYPVGFAKWHKNSRAALESAITLALAAERRRALTDAAELCDRWAESDWHGALLANQIRTLVDGKAGGT